MRNGKTLEYLELGVCNCAGCGCECVGERTQERLRKIPAHLWPRPAIVMRRVASRRDSRPYCGECTDRLEASERRALAAAGKSVEWDERGARSATGGEPC